MENLYDRKLSLSLCTHIGIRNVRFFLFFCGCQLPSLAICIEPHNSAMQIFASQLNSAQYFADFQLNIVFAGFQLNSARKQ